MIAVKRGKSPSFYFPHLSSLYNRDDSFPQGKPILSVMLEFVKNEASWVGFVNSSFTTPRSLSPDQSRLQYDIVVEIPKRVHK